MPNLNILHFENKIVISTNNSYLIFKKEYN